LGCVFPDTGDQISFEERRVDALEEANRLMRKKGQETSEYRRRTEEHREKVRVAQQDRYEQKDWECETLSAGLDRIAMWLERIEGRLAMRVSGAGSGSGLEAKGVGVSGRVGDVEGTENRDKVVEVGSDVGSEVIRVGSEVGGEVESTMKET
jgi:hypothetical protein